MKTKINLLGDYESGLVSNGARKNGMIITVSGISGSGKSTVVGILMKAFPEMDLVYSGGIFRENAKKAGKTLEEYSATRDEEDDIELDKEVLKRGMKGGTIIDSRLGAWALGDWADFRIFVTCPFGTRVDRVAKRENISAAQARNRVESRDSSDSLRYMRLYGIDINDLSVYDFIIDNSGSLKELESGVKRIIREIKNKG
jgi:cytidylate kinase